jgi:hypothetical protein
VVAGRDAAHAGRDAEIARLRAMLNETKRQWRRGEREATSPHFSFCGDAHSPISRGRFRRCASRLGSSARASCSTSSFTSSKSTNRYFFQYFFKLAQMQLLIDNSPVSGHNAYW